MLNSFTEKAVREFQRTSDIIVPYNAFDDDESGGKRVFTQIRHATYEITFGLLGFNASATARVISRR